MAIGIIRFPGSNCDRDVYKAIELAGGEADGRRRGLLRNARSDTAGA